MSAGSPMDCAAMIPTAVPLSTSRPEEGPAVAA